MTSEPPYDQEREPDDDETRRLLLYFTVAILIIIAALIVGMFLNGCGAVIDHGPTLPPLDATTTTTMLNG